MHIIFLKFSANKASAPEFMSGHNEWLQHGFSKGLFLVAGSLVPGQGGAILATTDDTEELAAFVDEDPFVQQGVATAEIHHVSPNRTDPRLEFLLS